MEHKFDKEFSDSVEAQNATFPRTLQQVTHIDFPRREELKSAGLIERWISCYFDLLVFKHKDGTERLHINRRAVDVEAKDWKGDITWDELQELKRQCGRGEKLAVEVFPPDSNIVNNRNIRHLWIVDETKIPFVWAHKSKSLSSLCDPKIVVNYA